MQFKCQLAGAGCPVPRVSGFITWQLKRSLKSVKNYRLPPSNRRCWRRCPDTVRLFSAQHRDICVFLKHRPRLHLEGGRWSSCITTSHLLSSWGEVSPWYWAANAMWPWLVMCIFNQYWQFEQTPSQLSILAPNHSKLAVRAKQSNITFFLRDQSKQFKLIFPLIVPVG